MVELEAHRTLVSLEQQQDKDARSGQPQQSISSSDPRGDDRGGGSIQGGKSDGAA
jgi:hypothetical protein